MRLPYSVQVFLVRIIDDQYSYLLLHRHARSELGLPEFWQGVSGALETGESFADAARREVYEETAIVLGAIVDTGFEHVYPIRPEWRSSYGPGPSIVKERVFFAIVPAVTEPTLSAEHQALRWCSSMRAAELLTFGANAQCLHAVERSIAREHAQSHIE